MIQEYLFVTDEYWAEIEALEFSDTIRKEVNRIENSSCWILCLEIDSESEDAAKTLDLNNTSICEKYKPIVLSNGSSAYFNKSLFPIVNEFERKLRKLLYLASSLQGSKDSDEVINNLESKELGEIFQALFSDRDFVSEIKATVTKKMTWQFTKKELLQSIDKIEENVLWDKLLGDACVATLRNKFNDIRNYRNDVMHAHNINLNQYKQEKKLFQKVNKELDIAIGKLIGTTDENKHIVISNFNDTLGNALKSLQNQVDLNQTAIMPDVIKELARNCFGVNLKLAENLPEASESILAAYVSTPAYLETISNISEVIKDISPATEALKKISEQMPTYKITVPQEVTKLQESLSRININKRITSESNEKFT